MDDRYWKEREVVENCKDISLLREINTAGAVLRYYYRSRGPQNPQSGTGPVVPIFAELSARKSSPRRRLAGAPGGCYNLYIKKKQEWITYGTTTNGPGAENHKKSYF